MLRHVTAASRKCARFWREKGVDLAAYNTVETAHDVDRLRQALGAPEMVLWGSSYGTQLGFAVIRHHGDKIARAVFSGVEGPDHTLKLPTIVDRQLRRLDHIIAEDEGLRIRYPEPQIKVARRILASAARQPYVVELPDPNGEAKRDIYIGRFELEQMIFGMNGTRGGMSSLPATLAAFDRGDMVSPFVRAVAEEVLEFRSELVESAMTFSVDCSLGASAARRALVKREARRALLTNLDFPVPDVCPAWDVPELPAVERSVLRSDIPILFLSGTLDGRTPAYNAEEMIRGFPNGRHVLIEGSGHGHDLFIGSPEIEALTLAFIRSGVVPITHIVLPPLPIE